MMKWLDFGMSDPLTLGMAHPLTDRLECLSTPKVSRGWSRIMTAAILLTLGSATAPFTIASAHPTPELDETVVKGDRDKIHRHTSTVTHNGVSQSLATIEVHRQDKGKMHKFEVSLDGDSFKAFKVCEDGTRTHIPLKDIKGYNAQKATSSKSWSFDVNDDNQLVFHTGKDVGRQMAQREAEQRSHEAFIKLKNLESFEELKGLEGLEKLKALESLKGLETLSHLKSLSKLSELSNLSKLSEMENVMMFEAMGEGGPFNPFQLPGDALVLPTPPIPPSLELGENEILMSRSFDFPDVTEFNEKHGFEFHTKDGSHYFLQKNDAEIISQQARLSAAKSLLENAERMLDDLGDMEESSSDLTRALKDLKRARKSLKNAEKKLESE